MEGKGEAVSSCLSTGGDKNNGVYYPMYFGVSCAFAAIRVLSSNITNMVDDGWTAMIEKMLQGSAQLLGVLVRDAQRQARIGDESDVLRKLHQTQAEVEEMKRRRRDDAKANAKVVAIYASQEQSWLSERKKLVQHLQCAVKSLSELKAKACPDCAEREDAICKLNEALSKRELELEGKDKALEEEEKRRVGTDMKLERAEAVAQELREMLDREAREHSSEIWKHKTAFVELVSSQRQLEAEMARVLKQVEAAKLEFGAVLRQKEEAMVMVDKFSMDLARMQRDAEKKDNIVSALLRKFRLDSEEKQKLVKELKITRAKRRQAELETVRITNLLESYQTASKHGKNLENVSSIKHDLRSEFSFEKSLLCIDYGSSHNSNQRNENCSNCAGSSPTKKNSQSSPKTLSFEYLEPEISKEHDCLVVKETSTGKVDCFDKDSFTENKDLVITTSLRQLENLVHLETEKYGSILEQRHDEEIEAFAEQTRLKDEKLEALRWQILSMEVESKRLQSHIDELNENLSQQRSEHIRLEALLFGKEKDLKAMNEKYTVHIRNCQSDSTGREVLSVPSEDAIWAEVKIIKRKHWGKDQEQKLALVAASEEVDVEAQEGKDCLPGIKRNVVQATPTLHEREWEETESESIPVDVTKTRLALPCDTADSNAVKNMGNNPYNKVEDESVVKTVIKTSKYQIIEEVQETYPRIEGTKEKFCINKNANLEENSEGISKDKNQISETNSFPGRCMIKKEGSWKMDIHALGVSYKIKRLKQQLFIIDRLTETHAEKHSIKGTGHSPQMTGLLFGVALLKKQFKRYQTLEEKTDDLCKRMHSNHQKERSKYSDGGRKEQSGALEQFLEEAFQLQRYMVATGQKLVEIMSETTCALVGSFDKVDGFSGVDVKQFADSIRTLLKEIQRGSEVRIARVIGDVEGTLACEGFLRLKN